MDLKSIEERWRIDLVREIARGGMSVVYEGLLRGVDGFSKTVAVKTLLDKWGANRGFMHLCAAEAKLVSGLVHENIVQILQLGRTSGGTYYIVMELVNGLPLRRLLDHHRARGGGIPAPLAVHIASRIARGLAYAHGFHDESGKPLHIVHRDVCPSNILITTEGLAKLTDFGVAKAVSMSMTSAWTVTGKVSYMAPEQAEAQEVDARADQFSLGAVLFEMLSGRPVRAPNLDYHKVRFAGLPIPWEALPPGLDSQLAEVLRRCLAPRPEDRFERTEQLATALEMVIYRDGYGPTIQTVEAHLRAELPSLYKRIWSPPVPQTGLDPSAETLADI